MTKIVKTKNDRGAAPLSDNDYRKLLQDLGIAIKAKEMEFKFVDKVCNDFEKFSTGIGIYYTLDEHKNVIPCSLQEWHKLFDEERETKKIVKQECIGNYFVSTIFVGIDHSPFADCFHVFETMVFDKTKNSNEIYCDRCGTYSEALEEHERAIKHVHELMSVEL